MPNPYPNLDHRPMPLTNTSPTHQASASTPPTTHSSNPNIPLRHITLPVLISAFSRHLFTSIDLLDTYFARIREIDHEFRAVVQISPIAVASAQALDAERRKRGPLHGVPIPVKDNIVTLEQEGEGIETTCGSMAFVGARAEREASIVGALRREGAVILGKGNMAEWWVLRILHTSVSLRVANQSLGRDSVLRAVVRGGVHGVGRRKASSILV
jgi:hypothetical protein